MDNGQNKARTEFHFKEVRERVREWVPNEELVRASKLTTRKTSGRRARYTIAE